MPELLGGMDAFGDVGADAVVAGEVAVLAESRISADGKPAPLARGRSDFIDEIPEGQMRTEGFLMGLIAPA